MPTSRPVESDQTPDVPLAVQFGAAAIVLPWLYFFCQFLPFHFLIRHWTLPAILALAGWWCLRTQSTLTGRILLVSAITLPAGYVGLGILILGIDRLAG